MLVLAWSGPAAALDIFVRAPLGNEAVFGTVEVDLEVVSAAEIAAVEVWLNGTRVASRETPPWRFSVDVGEENRSHVFLFRATDVDGTTGERTVETPALALDHVLDLELQQVYVTVTRDGARALDLTVDDFDILDNGARQTVVTFERGDVPFTAVVLLDTSLSMRGDQLRTALAGVRAFVAKLRKLDEAKLVLFADDTLAETPFTRDAEVMDSVIDGARATGGTAINDQLYRALKQLEGRQGRRVIVLLSDGIDVESVLAMRDVRWLAERVQGLFYWIRPHGVESLQSLSYHSPWRGPEGHRQELEGLEAAVDASGGQIITIDRIEEASGALDAVLAELRDQYVFGYYPLVNNNDGAWHSIRVRLRGARGKPRTRDGYFDVALGSGVVER